MTFLAKKQFEKMAPKNKLNSSFYFIFFDYEKVFIFDRYHCSDFNSWLAMISSSFCLFMRAYVLLLNTRIQSKSTSIYICHIMCFNTYGIPTHIIQSKCKKITYCIFGMSMNIWISSQQYQMRSCLIRTHHYNIQYSITRQFMIISNSMILSFMKLD